MVNKNFKIKKDLELSTYIKIENLPYIDNSRDIDCFIVLDNTKQTKIIKREDVMYDIKNIYSKKEIENKMIGCITYDGKTPLCNIWKTYGSTIRSLPATQDNEIVTVGQVLKMINDLINNRKLKK